MRHLWWLDKWLLLHEEEIEEIIKLQLCLFVFALPHIIIETQIGGPKHYGA